MTRCSPTALNVEPEKRLKRRISQEKMPGEERIYVGFIDRDYKVIEEGCVDFLDS